MIPARRLRAIRAAILALMLAAGIIGLALTSPVPGVG